VIDGVGHPLSMINAWDIPADQSSSNDVIQAKNGDRETTFEHEPRLGAHPRAACRTLESGIVVVRFALRLG
jgi:hypothetical protein